MTMCAPSSDRACAPMRRAEAAAKSGAPRALRRRLSGDPKVLAWCVRSPFQATGGLKCSPAISATPSSRRLPSSRIAMSSKRPPRCSTDQQELNAAFKAGEAGRRFHRRRALPGAEGQRHAGTAQADHRARHPAGPRPQGGAGHRRAHVRRFRQGAGGHPCDARGIGRRRTFPAIRTVQAESCLQCSGTSRAERTKGRARFDKLKFFW
jgi:hypothetical protein